MLFPNKMCLAAKFCYLYFQTFGPQNLEQVPLAEPSQFMMSEQQMVYTKQILESFSRGVYFKCCDRDIYAKRLCK